MATPLFTRETWLDLLVNIVPLVIMLFFVALFALVNPWAGASTLGRGLQYALVLVPFAALAILTYVAAVRIEGQT
jgi:hypothetical protein